MAKKQGNMFGSFGQAVEDREQEQQKIQATVTGSQMDPQLRKRGPGATTMTLTISQEDKQFIKSYAAMRSTTVSDLLHAWIDGLRAEG